MQQALLPLTAAAAFAFVTHRWISDELERERHLSGAAAASAFGMALLQTLLVALAAAGGVGGVGLPRTVQLGVGVPLAVLGGCLAITAWRALGSREVALAMRVDGVVTTGPYRFSRHPFYVGWTASLLGIAIAGGSGLALALVAVGAVALTRIARGEERWLLGELGASYEPYRRRAPALIGRPKHAAPVEG